MRPPQGRITLEGICAAPVNPAELETLPTIGELQGTTDISPYVNQTVSFRGVVTGSYEDRNAAGVVFYTLFVQDWSALKMVIRQPLMAWLSFWDANGRPITSAINSASLAK